MPVPRRIAWHDQTLGRGPGAPVADGAARAPTPLLTCGDGTGRPLDGVASGDHSHVVHKIIGKAQAEQASPTREGVLIRMNVDRPTQPMPEPIAEACAWLSAAERHDSSSLEDRLTAGDVLDDLTDVEPPYPLFDRSWPTVSLTEAAPHVIAVLERHLATDMELVDRLRVDGALGTLRHVNPTYWS